MQPFEARVSCTGGRAGKWTAPLCSSVAESPPRPILPLPLPLPASISFSLLRTALETRAKNINNDSSWDLVIDDLLDFLPQAGDRALMTASLEELEASMAFAARGDPRFRNCKLESPPQPPAPTAPALSEPRLSRAARRRRNVHLAKAASVPCAPAAGSDGGVSSTAVSVPNTSFGFRNGVLVPIPASPRGDGARSQDDAPLVAGAAAPSSSLRSASSSTVDAPVEAAVKKPSFNATAPEFVPSTANDAAAEPSAEEELPSREESLSFLASCYPQIDASAVNSVLDSAGDDPYEALRMLEDLVAVDGLPSSHDMQAPLRAPILHPYMTRAEALEALLLKYPQFGDASVASVLDAAGGDPLQAVEILDELLGDDADSAGDTSAVPSAGRPAPSPAASAAKRATADLMFRGMRADEKVARLLEAFPHFGAQAVEQTLRVVGGDVYRAIAVLEEADCEPILEKNARDAELLDFPALGDLKAAANRPSRRTFAATAANVAGKSDPIGLSGGGRSASGSRPRAMPNTPWQPSVAMERFTTGAEAAREYSDFRTEAMSLARQRSAIFQHATRAYLSGNRALAKELSRKGREISNAMQLAHERAADQIFLHRNTRSGGTGVFDLHNLHVTEAVRLADSVVEQAMRERRKSVCFVVGVGHHSKGRAKIGPTLLRHFVELGHDVDESFPGVLHVRI